MDDIQILFEDNDPIEIKATEVLNIAVSSVKQHSELEELDFESSGHTGFASSQDLENYIPKKLSILPTSTLSNRNAQIYLDNDGVSEKTTVQDLLNQKLKTVHELPNNSQLGDFVFLIKE